MLTRARSGRAAAIAAAALVAIALLVVILESGLFQGTVAGTVRGIPCASVEGGLAGCTVPMRHLPMTFQSPPMTATTVTDGNGRYDISLAPNIYSVSVGGSGYPLSKGPTHIGVGPGGSVRADFVVASNLL